VRVLYLDCFSGAAGDMFLGALIDAGVSLDDVRQALGSLSVDPGAVWTERVVRTGISATKFCVRGEDPDPGSPGAHDHAHDHGHGHDHAHDHSHGHDHESGHHHGHETAQVHGSHEHRTVREIHDLIDRSALDPASRERAKALFTRLGEAEAAVHGIGLDEVHLHEVGALDSIVDIVGAVYAVEALGVDRVVASPLNVGSGTVRSAHGLYPVPAPATLRLLEGAPVYAGPQVAELVTPTGALLVTDYATEYGAMPAMRVGRAGYGAGRRDFPDTPNVLRAVIGEMGVSATTGGLDEVAVLEAEIDDMNPQIFGVVMDQLLAAGALDVYYTPVQMKKNRPGTLLTVLAAPALRPTLSSLLFRETTTLGVRYQTVARECLARETVQVATPFGPIGIKVARQGAEVLNVAPEFDDCVRAAAAAGAPVKDVQSAALRAFHAGSAV
jgi:uncharacterized protein (TIGR00299 family) protein